MSSTSHKPYSPFRGVDNDPNLYSPLDLNTQAHSIRYVVLHPGSPGSPIVCSLHHAMLDPFATTVPSYEALSYTWGSVNDTVAITLLVQPQALRGTDSGCSRLGSTAKFGSFRVTRNLEEALRALRFEDPTCFRYLWNDAICINQMDPIEKNHQVGKMNLIYAYAETVLVWLGSADEDSALVLKGAEILEQETRNFTEEKRSETSRKIQRAATIVRHWTQLSESFYQALNDDEGQDLAMTFFRSLNRVFQRPWFSRVWVLPEVCLARSPAFGDRRITVVMGQSSMSWTDLMDLAATTNAFSLSRPLFHMDRMGLDNFYRAFWNPVNRYRPNDDDPGVTLAEWIHRTRHFLASDPRDKIFALLHVAIDTRYLIHDEPQIVPDYNKSLVDVMLDYSDAGLELPFGIKTDESDGEVTSTFHFSFWNEDHISFEASIPVEGEADSPIFPYHATRVALIEDPEEDLWDDAEQLDQTQRIFRTTNGRYSAAGNDIMRGNEIVTCVDAEEAFILAFISVTDGGVRWYACRGTCTRLMDDKQ